MSTQPVLSLAEAARACGVSVSTMRRRLPRLTQLGATRHDTSWHIPISALVAEGLMPSVTPPDTPSRDTLTRGMTPPSDTPSDTSLVALREQLAETEKRAAVAEAELRGSRALIDEKQRTIEAQAHALRLLEAPRQVLSQPATTPPVGPWVPTGEEDPRTTDPPVHKSRRRSWWGRLWGDQPSRSSKGQDA